MDNQKLTDQMQPEQLREWAQFLGCVTALTAITLVSTNILQNNNTDVLFADIKKWVFYTRYVSSLF